MVSVIGTLQTVVISMCLACYVGWQFADYFILWQDKIKSHFVFGQMDLYWSVVCLLPILLGHFVTIWGNYFRATSQFEHSIAKVTTPANKRQQISFWERHDGWLGFTIKFWCLVGLITVMNLYWFILTTVLSREGYVISLNDTTQATIRAIAYGSSQAVLLDLSIILFLVLRRSMLHALGFTYPELIPLHRWLGVAMLAWATIHGAFYSAWLTMTGQFKSNIAFTDKTRGTRDMPGVFAWFGMVIMAFFALPQFRRAIYPVFIYIHRAGTFVFMIGLMMHYPSVMLWYYALPGFVLFLLDRFVPKIMQARSINPIATCSFNTDADIIRVKFTSHEPIKPYYPGDYITVQIPGLGNIYHPFTIASYWPEDPYSITLYMRIFDSKFSWTKDLAKLCGNDDKRISIRANVDGVFGDRRHDYLKSETMIIFVAGAAITTFMALIKAIAAQIADSTEPLRMQLHMICTFRTRSELHAYGSFLHQITRDPRFTTWLHVEIYVSRPDKPQTLMGTHAHVVKNDIMVPGQTKKKDKKNRFASFKRTGTMLKRALSGSTIVETSPPSFAASAIEAEAQPTDMSDVSLERSLSVKSAVDTLNNQERLDQSGITAASSPSDQASGLNDIEESSIPEKPAIGVAYNELPLPTFKAAGTATISKNLAKFDLLTSAVLVVIPMAVYYAIRTVKWEGNPQFCPTTKSKDKFTIFVCQWTYALLPGFFHLLVFMMLGYTGIYMARKAHRRSQTGGSDVETAVPYPDFAAEDEKISIEDGNWDEGDVVYSRGRMDVRKVIQSFVELGVGCKPSQSSDSKKYRPLVTVFAGGPEGYVDMIERHCNKAAWSVEFHRETWAP